MLVKILRGQSLHNEVSTPLSSCDPLELYFQGLHVQENRYLAVRCIVAIV